VECYTSYAERAPHVDTPGLRSTGMSPPPKREDGLTMPRRQLRCFTVAMLLSLLGVSHALAQETRSLPPGTTPEMVSQGKKLFQGQALCFACHGADGKGVTGPDLTDGVWLHAIEDFEALVKLITTGINSGKSVTGQVMPAKGGSAISVAEARAVAAYVWSLSSKAPLE